MATTNLLRVEQLHVFYGDIPAVRGVEFHVDSGEMVSILGSNAAGKSTIMRTISGLLRPRSGAVLFKGMGIHHLACHRIVDLGVVHIPEGREIFAHMTVWENLEMGGHVARARRAWKSQGEQVLTLFPALAGRRRQLAGTLSGGEQQMLAIGRGLMARPELLMLDEPSWGLAPLLVRTIFEIVQTINRDGMTLLLVEQNVSYALEISHRAYVLENGEIVNQGRGQELLRDDHMRRAYLGM